MEAASATTGRRSACTRSVEDVQQRLAEDVVVVAASEAPDGAAARVGAAQPGEVGGERAADDCAGLWHVAGERQPGVERPQQPHRDVEHLREAPRRRERHQQVEPHR
uniref:Uncharacterized protein n=1 Tax=Triticum urartu TaxID=4572 RepID=A0A8R7TNE8_TRIUA